MIDSTTHKVIFVGNSACGKTCLLEVSKNGVFPQEYVPTIVENYTKKIIIDENVINLVLWDTAGQENYDSVRTIMYSGAELIAMCYSVEDTISFEALTDKWLPEITKFCPSAAIIVIALKIDLRGTVEASIDEKVGRSLATEIQAQHYIECSAKENINIDYVFQCIAKVMLDRKKFEKKFRCCCF